MGLKKADKIIICVGVTCAFCVMGFMVYSWLSDWNQSNEVIRLIQNDVYRYVHSINSDIGKIEDIIGDRTIVNISEMQMIWTITNNINNTLSEFLKYKVSVFVTSSDINPEWIQIRFQNCFDAVWMLKDFDIKPLTVM
jgi:hypothetical protein